jgi:hypothetical protein
VSSLAFFHQLLVFMSYSEDLPHRWTHLLVNDLVSATDSVITELCIVVLCSVLLMISGRNNAALILRNVHWVLLEIVSWVLGTSWSISYVNCWCFELWTCHKGQTHYLLFHHFYFRMSKENIHEIYIECLCLLKCWVSHCKNTREKG